MNLLIYVKRKYVIFNVWLAYMADRLFILVNGFYMHGKFEYRAYIYMNIEWEEGCLSKYNKDGWLACKKLK